MELTQISKNCHNCREGTPKCLLGQIQDERLKPKNIQVQGRPAIDILNKFKSNSFKDQYKIFIIGTNPDKESDKKDIPFLGAAGDFLTEFITKSGMPVDDVWCTYLVKCASPKGRNPSAGELNTCMSYIQEEIKRYKPEIIMLLGNIPLKLFNIREGGISKCRGKVFKKKLPDWEDGPEFSVIPSYNPATFVYRDNKKLRDLVIEDYCIAASLATGKEHKASFYQCNFTVAKTVEDVFTACEVMESEGIFGVDTESPNLNFMRAPMMLLQLSAGVNKTHLIPFYSHDPSSLGEWKLKSYWSNDDRNRVRDRLNKLFSHPKWKAVFHNAKYDLNIIKRWLSIDVKNEVHDTQVMHHLIYEYPPHDLKSLADMEFHVGDWEAPVREVVGGEEGDSNLSWDNCPDEILWPYGANDAELTRRLFDTYWETISSKPHLLKLYYEESIPITSTLQKAEWNGNKIDLKKVDEMEKLYLERMELSLIECRKLAGKPDFNPSSPDQVAEVLRGRATPENGILNLITDLTKSKGFSTGKDILIELDDPFAEKVLEYRKYRKLISTYIDRVREDIDETNRVRYQFRVAGTASGRLSCRFLQQIPRIDKESIKKEEVILRQMFIEDDGYDLVYFDVDQAELWVFAYKSQCKEMIRILESGEDIHRHSAAAALQISMEETSDFNRSNVGKCVDPSTIVICNGRISKIGDICKSLNHEDSFTSVCNKNIYTYSGLEAKLNSIYNGGIKPLKLITTRRGIIQCSDNHIFVKKDMTLIKARDLKIGDVLFEDSSSPSIKEVSEYVDISFISRSDSVPPTIIKTNKELAYICGVVIGDGCASSHQISIAHGDINKKDPYGILYKEWQDNLFNTFYSQGFNPKPRNKVLNLGCRNVLSYFVSLGVIKWRDKNSTCKIFEVPDWIIKSGREAFLSFLGGLIDTDGFVGKLGIVDLTSKSPILIGQIAALSSIYGLTFSTQREFNKQYNKAYYTITFRKKCNYIFKSYLKNKGKLSRLSLPVKPSKKELENSILYIEDSIVGQCLDLSIDSSDHLYWTNNIITHNSMNFGVIYGSQGFQIAKCEFQNPKTGKLEKVGRDRAMLFASNFMKKYPEIEIYKADLVDISLANNCVYRTEFGREIHVPELTSNDDRRVNTLTRELLNKSVQGPAGSITLRTLNMIDAVLAKYNIDTNQIRLINTVHDSGLYGVKKHLTEWFKGIIKSVAERPIPEIYNKKFTVKIGVGSNWAEAELNAK